DSGLKLRRPSDSFISDRGRLGPLHLRWRQWQKLSAAEAKAVLGWLRVAWA
ncbi:hypothetical protein BHE74_00052042, partial [Ensete ventricosum]